MPLPGAGSEAMRHPGRKATNLGVWGRSPSSPQLSKHSDRCVIWQDFQGSHEWGCYPGFCLWPHPGQNSCRRFAAQEIYRLSRRSVIPQVFERGLPKSLVLGRADSWFQGTCSVGGRHRPRFFGSQGRGVVHRRTRRTAGRPHDSPLCDSLRTSRQSAVIPTSRGGNEGRTRRRFPCPPFTSSVMPKRGRARKFVCLPSTASPAFPTRSRGAFVSRVDPRRPLCRSRRHLLGRPIPKD